MTPATRPLRLYVNVDHVATLRQARRGLQPDPFAAARLCEDAGADGITAHLREDRRHMIDADIDRLVHGVRTVFNLEMACTDEMLGIAERTRPFQVTLVPERRVEITTEGGLDTVGGADVLAAGIARLRRSGIRVSLFVDPDPRAVTSARGLGADAVELHTGAYAAADQSPDVMDALRTAARLAASLGLAVHAGHGLTLSNVGAVASVLEIEELNIGHAIVSRSVFVGLGTAVREMREAIRVPRPRFVDPSHPQL
ncbi:MAG: pyridoxine 5'-phosphate synthase [Gemmatimonadaceae bacterium]